jgi:hypothetical protein
MQQIHEHIKMSKQEIRMNNQIWKDFNGAIQQHLFEVMNKTMHDKYQSLKSNYVSLKK